MTIDQVEKFRFWFDSRGNIWERQSFCLEPTATFVRMTSGGPECVKPSHLGGAIGCLNLADLKPIEAIPDRASSLELAVQKLSQHGTFKREILGDWQEPDKID